MLSDSSAGLLRSRFSFFWLFRFSLCGFHLLFGPPAASAVLPVAWPLHPFDDTAARHTLSWQTGFISRRQENFSAKWSLMVRCLPWNEVPPWFGSTR
jgi:hypothetical protein